MIAALFEGKLARAEPGCRGLCPECKTGVYARMPAFAIRHWAHFPLPEGETRDCARGDAGGMTAWHYAWQNERNDLDLIEVSRDNHRADVVNTDGVVIEFQHSPISPEDVKDREQFWRKGIWVIDGTPHEDGSIRVELSRLPDQKPDDPYCSFRWSRAPQVLYTAKWPVWIDTGDRGLVQVRAAGDSRGTGWLADRDWFIAAVINGPFSTLKPHVGRLDLPRQRQGGHARAETERDLALLPVGCSRIGVDGPLYLTNEPCCGEHPPGVLGEPIVLACQLCPTSPTYWRNR
jgi:hypothetical protein